MPAKLRWIGWMVLLALLPACATMPAVAPNPANPVKSVAVLPLCNNTNDVEAPQMVREKMFAAVEKYQYCLLPLETTDQILRDRLGITLGGQLKEASPEQLGQVLGVDALLYGTLLDFNETTTGAYNVRKVRATFRLVQSTDGQTLWENGLGVKSELKMAGDMRLVADAAAALDAGKKEDADIPWVLLDSYTSQENLETTLAFSLGAQLLSKATGMHLERETRAMVKRIMRTFPAGPGQAVMTAQ